MSTLDNSVIDELFGNGASAPIGFEGGGYQKNPNIYSFDKKKRRTLANGQQVNSVRGRLLMRFAGNDSSVTVKTHSVKYGSSRNYIQICGKSIGEHCPTCGWISDVWDTLKNTGVKAPPESTHRAGKLSLRKDAPGDVWMNFYVENDFQSPENNGKVFAYRLPAALRDAYNAAIVGGVDPMGKTLEKYDPAHPINGCFVEVVAFYNNDKTDYKIKFDERTPMFGGNMDHIKHVVNMTHDLKAIVRGEAQMDKAQSRLEYFLKMYQPSAPAGNTANAGGFAGPGGYGTPQPGYGTAFGAPVQQGYSTQPQYQQQAPGGFAQVPSSAPYAPPAPQAAGGFSHPHLNEGAAVGGFQGIAAGFSQGHAPGAPQIAQNGFQTPPPPAGFVPPPPAGFSPPPAGFIPPPVHQAAPPAGGFHAPVGGIQQKQENAFENLENL